LKGDRAEIKRPVDNLTNSDAKFYEKPVENFGPGERRAPIIHKDNIQTPEGKFYSPPKEDAPLRGDRAPIKKPQDQFPISEGNLTAQKSEGRNVVNTKHCMPTQTVLLNVLFQGNFMCRQKMLLL
jgi:hypothetical protein